MIKKYVENIEIRGKNQEKRNQQYESEKVNKVNNNPKLNVDDQIDAIKHLKEHLKQKALCVKCSPSSAKTTKNY